MGPWETCSLHMSRIARHGSWRVETAPPAARGRLGVVARLVSTLREGQAEGEQGMLVARDVAHADTHLACRPSLGGRTMLRALAASETNATNCPTAFHKNAAAGLYT